jgi:four helix bundle protein
MSDYRQLEVWQKAHAVTMEIYALTKSFPSEERFGLVTQMRRAAVSIGANLAEGRGRRGDPEFGRFIKIALGSAYELEYELLVAADAGFISRDTYDRLRRELNRVGKMLWSLLERVNAAAAARV